MSIVSPQAGFPQSPATFGGKQYICRQMLVQLVAYNSSISIFNYSPESFCLDAAVRNWASAKRTNVKGELPEVINLESRSGSGAALLGYIENMPVHGLVSVLVTSDCFEMMLPFLLQHRERFAKVNLVFHVATVRYDADSYKLVEDVASAVRVARQLRWPVVASDLNGVQKTAILASQIAAAGPVVHVYDGVYGSHEFGTTEVAAAEFYSKFETVSDISKIFAQVNAALGTQFSPIEVNGKLDNKNKLSISLGGSTSDVSVRVLTQTTISNLLDQLPLNVAEISSDKVLYPELITAVNLKYGVGKGPLVTVGTPSAQGSNGASGSLFFDTDSSQTVGAPLAMARYLEANYYAVYDNLVAGGAVEVNFNLPSGSSQRVTEAEFIYVGSFELLRVLNVAARAKPQATLVVGGPADKLEKLPAPLKRAIAAKQLKVAALDFKLLDPTTTQDRTGSFAVQAAFWLAEGHGLDQITTRIVQANGKDMELVAATVNNLITAMIEAALVNVDTSAWAEAKDEKELAELPPSQLTETSFTPVQRTDNLRNIQQLSVSKFSHRFAFREAFDDKLDLRPDLATKNYVAKVQVNQRVTPATYDRYIFHLELDITGTGMTYAIGEALGVHAPNDSVAVDNFIEWYGIDPNEVVGVPHFDSPERYEYKTAYQALRDNLDLFGKVPKRFYEALAAYAKDDKQRVKLEYLADPAGNAELKKRSDEDFDNYVDILHEFDSAHPPLANLLEMIAPLKRREYSIASSQKVHPNAVHLLIVVVDWTHKSGEKRYGQTSKFLAELQPGAEVVVSVKPSVMKLPKDSETPIIMAGLGTGLAPFKAFLEEKMWQRDQGMKIGEVYLFLGSRHQREEYLYGEYFEAYKDAGVLTHIGAAFSRDQPQKIYIQHRIAQAKDKLTKAFVHNNGNFYLCGPTWPVPDISAALSDIVITNAKARGEKVDASRLIEQLKDDERYILEVY